MSMLPNFALQTTSLSIKSIYVILFVFKVYYEKNIQESAFQKGSVMDVLAVIRLNDGTVFGTCSYLEATNGVNLC